MFQLIHSPSVGPRTWEPVAAFLRALGNRVAVPDIRPVARAKPPYWRTIVQLAVSGLRGMPTDEPVLLCAHSNAGVFLPLIATSLGRPVAGLIFVDASVPPDRGEAEMVPAEFLNDIRERAIEGLLPRWTDWWPEADVAALFADEVTRREVIAEQVRLPVDYYEEKVPVPEGWRRIPAAYLLFGPP
jgi:pimeloyl-ACP methyl ester carboxylesterase